MDVTRGIKKAMIKDEVSLLLDLIQENPIINARETNAATNKLKDDAWTSMAQIFNARTRSRPRTKEQLKLKWDNLKKAARKRAQQIHMDQQIDGAKLAYMTPDAILDKVAELLEYNYTGPTDPLGGDNIGHGSPVLAVSGGITTHIVTNKPILALKEVPIELENVSNDMGIVDETSCEGTPPKKREIESVESDSFSSASSKHFYDVPTEPHTIKKKGKNRSDKVEMSIVKRNLAIAKYYDKRSEKLDLEIKLLNLELAKKQNNAKNYNVIFTAEFVLSRQGNRMLKVDGYTYTLIPSKSWQKRWRCSTRHVGCLAFVTTMDDVIIYINGNHIHPRKDDL